MNLKKFNLSIIAMCCATGLFSQTLSQAQRWFNEGEYEKAKPVFRKLTKASPSNINYRYWYGACCYETGELMEALPHLEKCAQRKMINGYLYLSKAYFDLYRFDEAIENMENHIYWLERRKRDRTQADSLLLKYRQGARLMRGVENIVVVDSFVVDKDNFLSAYALSKETGKIEMTGDSTCTRFTNQMNDKRMESRLDTQNNMKLYASMKLTDKWSTPESIPSLNDIAIDLNYPFVHSDGITVYYSAKGEDTMGGYDIFVTRYDNEGNEFFKPDNLGMPFNSTYNDYMYVIDDFRGLGWFASDRHQPEGKVCIYVFVPNETKKVHDFENTDQKSLTRYASLYSIKDTWTDSEVLEYGRQQLASALNHGHEEEAAGRSLYIVINDKVVYNDLKQFKSKEAAMMYLDLRAKKKDFKDFCTSLDKMRKDYRTADPALRNEMSASILDKERRIIQFRKEIAGMEKNIRNLEITALKAE